MIHQVGVKITDVVGYTESHTFRVEAETLRGAYDRLWANPRGYMTWMPDEVEIIMEPFAPEDIIWHGE